MLSLRGVSVRFDDGRSLFDGVELEVASTTRCAVVGPSGVGKSTLLAVLGGLLDPSTGQRVSSLRAADCSWVLQDCRLVGYRSVAHNAVLAAELAGVPRDVARQEAWSALKAVDLDTRATSPARRLSGGERQRLVVARALASSRRLILADEPTSHLDRVNARLVMGALFEVGTAAVVVVTHDVESLPPAVPLLRLTEHGLEPMGSS